MSTAALKAWGLAEEQVAQQLAKIVGLPYGLRFFVGDEVDMENKINCACFWIAGGQEQDQGFQAGATAWHVEGRIFGAFTVRADARAMGSALLDAEAIPFEGGEGTDMPQVAKVYLRQHPTLARRPWAVANRKAKVRAAIVECVLGVVYQE